MHMNKKVLSRLLSGSAVVGVHEREEMLGKILRSSKRSSARSYRVPRVAILCGATIALLAVFANFPRGDGAGASSRKERLLERKELKGGCRGGGSQFIFGKPQALRDGRQHIGQVGWNVPAGLWLRTNGARHEVGCVGLEH